MPRQSFVSVRQLRRNFDDGRPSAEGHPRWHNQPCSNLGYSVAMCLAQWTAHSHAARNAVRYYCNHSLDGATCPLYFPNLIQINYDLMLRMKCLWFVPNLIQILSISLKLQAVKQCGPGFFGLPGSNTIIIIVQSYSTVINVTVGHYKLTMTMTTMVWPLANIPI